MKTKLSAILILLILIVPQLFAQSRPKGDSKIGFGLIGGVNLQILNGKDFWGEQLKNKLVFGFHGGLNASIPFAPDLYFQPGLLYTVKGAQKKIFESPIKGDEVAITTTINLNYIELPLNLLYRPQLGDGHIILGFGPYAAYGISGKVKTRGGNLTSNLDVKFKNIVKESDSGDDFAYYRPFDAGANILAGYEFYYGVFLQLNAQVGLLKVNPEYELLTNDKTSYRNNGFGLSAGYRF